MWRKVAVGVCGAGGAGIFLFQNGSANARQPHTDVFDAAVVGGGVVGLAVCRDLAASGVRVALLEKEHSLVTGASSGNSGLGCTGYDAPEGSLERQLLRRSIQRHQNLYRSFGLSYDHVNKCGALVVAWTPEELAALPAIVEENHVIGDTDVRLLSRDELLETEPALSPDALGGVLIPREVVAEPWLVPMGYAESARKHGAEIMLGSEVVGAKRVSGSGGDQDLLWHLETPHGVVVARTVINCGGLYGDTVEAFHRESSFTIKPRKGQFVVFQPAKEDSSSGPSAPVTIIEPVPTQRTKGVIVWTTVYGNVVVGPTAEDQESRTDRSNDPKTIEMLKSFGERVVPALRNARVIGTYSGLRPASEHRDYVIEADRANGWITVGGIRSTGLTAASGIGEYVAQLYHGFSTVQDLPVTPPYPASPLSPVPKHVNTTVPPLAELAQDFRQRADGFVTLWGHPVKVTHPISILGLQSFGADRTEDN